MSAQPDRRWLDVNGVFIRDGAQVELVGPRRLSADDPSGVVVGRRKTKLVVVFGDQKLTVPPSEVRVVPVDLDQAIGHLRSLVMHLAHNRERVIF